MVTKNIYLLRVDKTEENDVNLKILKENLLSKKEAIYIIKKHF